MAGVVLAVGAALIYSAARAPRPSASVQVARAKRRVEHPQPQPVVDQVSSNASTSKPLDSGETSVPVPEPSGKDESDPSTADPSTADPSTAGDAKPASQLTSPTALPDTSDSRNIQPAAAATVTRSVVATRPGNRATSAPDGSRPTFVAVAPPIQQHFREQHAGGSQAVPQPHVVTLEPGLALTIRLAEKLSTDYNYTGDTFRGTLQEPLIANGFIIADRGSTVFGRIKYARKSRLLRGGISDLTLTLTEMGTTDGQTVDFETSPWEEKGTHTNLANPAKLVGTAFGAVIKTVSGTGRGAGSNAVVDGSSAPGQVKVAKQRTIVLPKGTQLTFRLAAPLTIRERLNVH